MRSAAFGVLVLLLPLGSVASARVWTDDSGQREAEAEFVALDGGVARFQMPDGEVRRCSIARLSLDDQALVARLAGARQADAAASARAPISQTLTAAAGCAGDCTAPSTYECTIMVPEWVTEMRTVMACEWRSEQRQRTYTVCRMVPETRQVTYEYTVPTYETRTRPFVYSVFKPVVSTHQREFTVMVPHVEKRQGTRQVCQMVPVEMTRTVCEDHGGWQQVVRRGGCDCCGPCEQTCNIWVPKLEQREVKYTVMRPQVQQVPYEYHVTVCKPERRTESYQVCNYVAEQQTRDVPYTVCVPVKKTGTREVTSYRRVEEPRTDTYTVQVPHQVEKQVPVQVCRMVAKKVTRTVPQCGWDNCGSGCGWGWRGCGGCW